MLEKSNLPSGRVLTDDCYLAVALRKNSRFQPVMAWSPEVAFVVDPELDPVTVRRRLRDRQILFVAPFPENNRYFAKHPFFREDSRNWLPITAPGDRRPIYSLPP